MKEPINIEAIANRLLQDRGYLVVGSHDAHALGHVLELVSGCDPCNIPDLNHKAVIVAETDIADMHAQMEMMGLDPDLPCPRGYQRFSYFYRAIAE